MRELHSKGSLRVKPIFDTNIFGHVQDGLIPKTSWGSLLLHRPRHGWPLSSVTVLELMSGIDAAPAEKFPRLRERIQLAWDLSKGRVFDDPRFLLCEQVLHLPFPSQLGGPLSKLLRLYLDVVRRAESRTAIREHRVPLRGLLTSGKGRAGFDTSVFPDITSTPKADWKRRVEALASDVYPNWREHLIETGKRLPEPKRELLSLPSAWEPERLKFCEDVLHWFGANSDTELLARIRIRLDAVLEFTIYVTREFLTRDYNLDKHESDVFDQFQLHYLALDDFVIVSEDSDLSKRTSRSAQTGRIHSFEDFLKELDHNA